MNRSAGNSARRRHRRDRYSLFPASLSFLVLLFVSCGGGGGGVDSPPLPIVTTDNATSVTQNGAELNGNVNPNGTSAQAWFEYGTNPNLASYDNTPIQTPVTGSITEALAGLTPGKTYYFRLVASNANGWAEGKILSFTAHNPPPVATTDNASAITLNGATLNGTVNPNGAATIAWFEYGPDPTLAAFTATDNQNLGSGRDPVAMDNTLSGLNPGDTYYYRVVATSVEGEVEGEIKSFRTVPPTPAATTESADNVTTTSATLQGTVNPNGFSTEAWFEYGTDNTLANPTATTPQFQGSGTTTLPVSAPVTSLTPWRTWYFRTVARSTIDPDVFTKGAIHSFPTGDYYVAVGDSITLGSHDDISSDDTSQDGRNTGWGFEPILNNLLTAWKGYPHTVVNKGVSGHTSADGVSSISSTLSNNPSAKYFLIMYGTNDATNPPIPSGRGLIPGDPGYSGSFKDNMQRIVSAVLTAGKVPYLAKVPYVDPTNPLFPLGVSFSDAAIQSYNTVIDELRISNGISVVAPDFYTWFQNHTGQLADGIHPNGTGYQSMAGSGPDPNPNLNHYSWFYALTH